MHGITSDKTLNQLIYGLEPIIGPKVLKKNPQSFEEACVLAKCISWLANLVGGGGICSKWHEPTDHAPIELDSISTC